MPSHLDAKLTTLIQGLKCLYGKNECVKTEITNLLQANSPEELLWEIQDKICNEIVNDKFLIAYPASKKYRKTFFKTLISHLESMGCEVHDGILSRYIKLLSDNETNEKYFLVFFLKVNKIMQILFILM
jgi:hypothetical protein